MMFNKILIVYVLCGFMAAGHWMANKYESFEKNPVSTVFVMLCWPAYASYAFFDEEE